MSQEILEQPETTTQLIVPTSFLPLLSKVVIFFGNFCNNNYMDSAGFDCLTLKANSPHTTGRF